MSIGVLLGKQLARAIKGTGDDVADETVEALGKTSAKPERFDPEALKSAANQNDLSRDILVEMPIDDFLSAAKKVDPSEITNSNKKLNAVRKVRDEGIPFKTIPTLSFNNMADGTGKVSGHDGRHRALALKEIGETTIPVILKSDTGGKGQAIRWGQQNNPDNTFDFVDILPTKLLDEEGEGIFIDMPSTAKNIRKKASAENIRSLVQRPVKSRSFIEAFEGGKDVIPKVLNKKGKQVDPDYVYRTMSRKEYESIKKTGKLTNTGIYGRIHASASPLAEFSNKVDDTVTVKIKYSREDGWKAKYSGSGEVYAVTDQDIPASRIELVE
jgi:hypothetical protein